GRAAHLPGPVPRARPPATGATAAPGLRPGLPAPCSLLPPAARPAPARGTPARHRSGVVTIGPTAPAARPGVARRVAGLRRRSESRPPAGRPRYLPRTNDPAPG